MNYELIAIIILAGSLLGMKIILFRKIPILLKLPETTAGMPEESFFSSILKKKTKILNPFNYFSNEIFLQKILSKIRVLTLKTDNRTSNWLQELRKKSQKDNFKEDNYWKELKTSLRHGENLDSSQRSELKKSTKK